MTVFESTALITKPVSMVYTFLTDMHNHQQLMPDSISNWSSTTDEARFTIQNMAKLALKVSERKENSEIIIMPSEPAPFDIELRWILQDNNDDSTSVTYKIAADLNMMMKMLASGPLQKLVEHETAQLKNILQ